MRIGAKDNLKDWLKGIDSYTNAFTVILKNGNEV